MNYEIKDTAHLTFHKCCLLWRTILILRYTVSRKTLYDNPSLQFTNNKIQLIMAKNKT